MLRNFFKISHNTQHVDILLLVLRVCVAIFMLVHGMPKLMKFFADEPVKFADPIGIGQFASLLLTVFSEVICSVLIFFGLATRLATVPLIVTMLVAAIIVHSGDPFGDKEASLQYFLVYLTLFVLGSGRYSVDALISRK